LINKLVVENLKHRPLRTFLSVLAIGVEVTMMLTLVGLSEGMLEDFARRARGVGADVLLRAPGTSVFSFSSAGLREGMLKFAREQPHVTLATGTVVHPLQGVTSITGIDLATFTTMSGGFKYLAGGPFQGPNDVLIDEYYARQGNSRVGSTVRLLNRDWTVRGIVEPGKLSRIFAPIEVLQDLTNNTGKLSAIYIKLDHPSNTGPVISALKARLPDYQIWSMEEYSSLISVNNVPMLKPFLLVIVGLSVVVGFLAVSLTMYTAVLERTREIGILKALGATPAFVLGILFRETTLLAMIGSAIGILLSYATRWLIMTLVPAALTQSIVPMWWPIAAGISLVGALLGAIYPGLKAARQDAIEALAYE
jgi:putative ABC transport system permease protein